MKAWTDYPFTFLGDVENREAPVREIEVVSYDGDKYCEIVIEGVATEIKAGYIYMKEGRYGEVPCLNNLILKQLEGA